MGQYHLVANLDKREFLHPHRLGHGLKLWEFVPSENGPMQALGLLLTCSNGRGAGDFSGQYSEAVKGFIGRWAGDRIVIVGDYAEDGDTGREYDGMGSLYEMCTDDPQDRASLNKWRIEQGQEPIPDGQWLSDISPLARQAMSEVFGLEYSGAGWLQVSAVDYSRP